MQEVIFVRHPHTSHTQRQDTHPPRHTRNTHHTNTTQIHTVCHVYTHMRVSKTAQAHQTEKEREREEEKSHGGDDLTLCMHDVGTTGGGEGRA